MIISKVTCHLFQISKIRRDKHALKEKILYPKVFLYLYDAFTDLFSWKTLNKSQSITKKCFLYHWHSKSFNLFLGHKQKFRELSIYKTRFSIVVGV